MTLLPKTLQRRLFTVLSDRNSLLTVTVVCGLVVVSLCQFGEAWFEWSADKYEAWFNSFSDNLAGRSLQSRLCQYVPVDVVYTWVNGSDPVFLEDLKHVKEKWINTQGRVRLRSCPYSVCVPAHILATETMIRDGITAGDLSRQNQHMSGLAVVRNERLICGEHVENRTLLYFNSVSSADQSINGSELMTTGLKDYPLHKAYWTTEWTVPYSFPMANFAIISGLPDSVSETKLRNVLPMEVDQGVQRVWVYPDQGVGIIRSENISLLLDFVQDNPTIDLGGGSQLSVHAAHLIVQLPQFADDDSFYANRFADYDQLRYSLRSVEKYAPWVRHVYIVTNGQIPSWLNMDHPKVTVVTHQDIFPSKSSLPTFSSSAIETNLVNIPGLSERFLYLNDDVMLGKEVWPEDFYSDFAGFKIRLSWDLPDCSEDCTSSWLNDGYCDAPCNTTKCGFDGGDCIGPNVKHGFGDADGGNAYHWDRDGDFEENNCAPGCLDYWIADGFCDDPCNAFDCGFDAGDCGKGQFSLLHQVPFNPSPKAHMHQFTLPKGTTVVYWDLELLIKEYEEVELVPIDHPSVRSASLSLGHQVLVLILFDNVTESSLVMSLQGKTNQTMVEEQFNVAYDTHGHERASDDEIKIMSQLGVDGRPDIPPAIERAYETNAEGNVDLRNVDDKLLSLSEIDSAHLRVLTIQLDQEELTLKGFHVKRSILLRPYVRRYLVQGGRLRELQTMNLNETIPAPNARLLLSLANASPDDDRDEDTPSSLSHRHILDAYGESLLKVQRLFSQVYGSKNRKVPSHMPLFLDLSILRNLLAKFPEEWAETSGRRFRSGDDMQFSFSYYHFLMSEREEFDPMVVFDQYDTDSSGTWSDREIRTLLTRMHNLPLYLETVRDFENLVMNCSKSLPKSLSNVKAPLYERYFDSQLPLVSRALILKCPLVLDLLQTHFGHSEKFKHTVLGDTDVAFKKLTSNMSSVVHELDDLRRNQFKFICINDDTDGNREKDNEQVRLFLLDYFESILPVPSQFELPVEYRNKFQRTVDLERWQFFRNCLKFLLYLSVFSLLGNLIAGYYQLSLVEVAVRVIRTLIFIRSAPSKSKSKV
eukprot:maker-scaffold556_size137522-snap-gene-0.27 protein:Tk02042 transcript:maker-scaffold556_size137522-snap-gene-0.27-mRNA-1 annotation:"hypothetical protein LOTGIDRAFT_238796"